ncbi:MAG: hypothetical protein IJZ25_02375 [Lachnospiraceae bacterium]|nr:hypothetical protein [Lachnospiraceae bacterium]
MENNVKTNREYKDKLFCLLFGNEKYKENTLALYNALNGTTYTNPEDVNIYTIEDVIYIDMKNDVAFILDSEMNLWEHQSTYNPNMPLRGFMYFGKLYDKYIVDTYRDIYRKKLVTIPTPKYVVFYNGEEKRPAVEKLKLSDAFIHEDSSGDFEWTATVINLNHPDISTNLLACKALADYVIFVKKVQTYKKSNNLAGAINRAVDECIKEDILKKLLLQHRAEVIELVLTTYNKELHEKYLKEDAREEGLAEGRAEGLKSAVKTAAMFTSDVKLIHAAVIKNEPYQDITLEQVEKILKGKV